MILTNTKFIYLFSKLHSKLKPNKLFCIYQ